MPTQTITHNGNEYTFDARPDRIDIRDQEYQQKLVSLPKEFPSTLFIKEHFEDYRSLVLDQGKEGACTGFGLAAMINYLRFRYAIENGVDKPQEKVSPAMLYHLARIYDEWAGEDYEGSSCRGAMKGWHKHGVCSAVMWPYVANNPQKPAKGWGQEAAEIPLGAYFRVDKKSIAAIHSAIHEVGAVYASADVHSGWFKPSGDEFRGIPTIKPNGTKEGGHAFALVGYDEYGFLIQNSWGAKWGKMGFARLTYSDWAADATDAWVAVLGAPMKVPNPPQTTTDNSLTQSAALETSDGGQRQKSSDKDLRWSLDQARNHMVILGNNGIPINRFVDEVNVSAAVKRVAYENPLQWLSKKQGNRKIVIYAHGGLNSEEGATKRVQVMAGYFQRDGVYPIFIAWKTGFLESLTSMLEDAMDKIIPGRSGFDLWDKLKEKASDARDYAVEAAARRVLVKAIWSEMKENALMSAESEGGTNQLAVHLAALAKQFPDMEIHLVGHSAGAIYHGHLLSLLTRRKLKAASCHLYAPACTVEFANRYYGNALDPGKGTLEVAKFFIDIMSEERERADIVGAKGYALYGKSLLYLVSRALEKNHKTPLLGMEAAWDLDLAREKNIWNNFSEVAKWLSDSQRALNLVIHDKRREYIETGSSKIKLAHGSFDNDKLIVSKTIERIIGKKPTATGWDLTDF